MRANVQLAPRLPEQPRVEMMQFVSALRRPTHSRQGTELGGRERPRALLRWWSPSTADIEAAHATRRKAIGQSVRSSSGSSAGRTTARVVAAGGEAEPSSVAVQFA